MVQSLPFDLGEDRAAVLELGEGLELGWRLFNGAELALAVARADRRRAPRRQVRSSTIDPSMTQRSQYAGPRRSSAS